MRNPPGVLCQRCEFVRIIVAVANNCCKNFWIRHHSPSFRIIPELPNILVSPIPVILASENCAAKAGWDPERGEDSSTVISRRITTHSRICVAPTAHLTGTPRTFPTKESHQEPYAKPTVRTFAESVKSRRCPESQLRKKVK
jgi:hypothetical protein